MTKKVINQNTKLNQEIINTIEPKFIFADKPINRFGVLETEDDTQHIDKKELLKIKKSENAQKIIANQYVGLPY